MKEKIKEIPALTKSGGLLSKFGGKKAVLEYRVWIHYHDGGDDEYCVDDDLDYISVSHPLCVEFSHPSKHNFYHRKEMFYYMTITKDLPCSPCMFCVEFPFFSSIQEPDCDNNHIVLQSYNLRDFRPSISYIANLYLLVYHINYSSPLLKLPVLKILVQTTELRRNSEIVPVSMQHPQRLLFVCACPIVFFDNIAQVLP